MTKIMNARIRDQAGLKLESRRRRVDVFVVESAERAEAD